MHVSAWRTGPLDLALANISLPRRLQLGAPWQLSTLFQFSNKAAREELLTSIKCAATSRLRDVGPDVSQEAIAQEHVHR